MREGTASCRVDSRQCPYTVLLSGWLGTVPAQVAFPGTPSQVQYLQFQVAESSTARMVIRLDILT